MGVMDLFNLEGKVALVTGGTHGIGMAVGMVLGQAGAKICVNDIDEAKLESAKKEYAAAGIDAYTLVFNVCSEAEVDAGISKIEQNVGEIDILVNNAGIIKRIPILDMPVSEFEQVIDVDLIAPFIVGKRVAPNMIKKREGKIINLCYSIHKVYNCKQVVSTCWNCITHS